ncbi:MAG TPA: DinB family protein [Jatrophihabitantaceae bacterium]|jgi:hypothetical protein|nr:DinB family protein [Jatrophihabitantaceae bacterium]
MSEPTLTATAGGAELLAPLLAQWDTSLAMLLERLDGLTDVEYRWPPTPGAADLADDGTGVLRADQRVTGPTRTIAWNLGHLADMCWLRADYTDGAKNRPLEAQPFPGRADDAVGEVRDAAARWRAAIAAATAQQAVQVGYSSYPVGMDPDLPFVDIVWWMNRELIAHGSDIATVRDLYEAR